jgi:hypothetical protein
MAMVKVYRFRTYNNDTDDYFVSTRMATLEKIKTLKTVEAILESEADTDDSLLTDGLTDRNFNP